MDLDAIERKKVASWERMKPVCPAGVFCLAVTYSTAGDGTLAGTSSSLKAFQNKHASTHNSLLPRPKTTPGCEESIQGGRHSSILQMLRLHQEQNHQAMNFTRDLPPPNGRAPPQWMLFSLL